MDDLLVQGVRFETGVRLEGRRENKLLRDVN